MASAKKRTREELIAGGYCPNCSKCAGQLGGGLSGCAMLYGCRKCGTFLLELSCLHNNPEVFGHHALPCFVDVTEHWQELRDWYENRLEEIRAQASKLEMQLLAEVPGVIAAMLTQTNSARAFKGLTLIKG